jgi:voltage-gated potassium channel
MERSNVRDDPSGTSTGFRPGSRLDARVKQVAASRRIFPFLVVVTVGIALFGGFVATLVDEKDFPTFGDATWWALVTLATVGYGDIVPTTTAGRAVGSALIVFGVTFLSFLTATITSLFVSVDRERQQAEEQMRQEAVESETRALLLQLDKRLASIEAKLDQ